MKPDARIVAALLKTERAHRLAVKSGEETDAGWAAWYAAYLLQQTDFQHLTSREWTVGDLAQALESLNLAYENSRKKDSWVHYYAARLDA